MWRATWIRLALKVTPVCVLAGTGCAVLGDGQFGGPLGLLAVLIGLRFLTGGQAG